MTLNRTTTSKGTAFEGKAARGPSDDAPAYGDYPPEALAREIERLSADGRPAHPEVGPGAIALLLASLGFIIVLVGIGAGMWLGPRAGVAIGGLGLVLFLLSPAFWASVSRARERARAKRRLDRRLRGAGVEQPSTDS